MAAACPDAARLAEQLAVYGAVIAAYKPEYLPKTSGVVARIASVRLQGYDEAYNSAISARDLAAADQSYASRTLAAGDLESACKFYERMLRNYTSATQLEVVAIDVWNDRLSSLIPIVKAVADTSCTALRIGGKVASRTVAPGAHLVTNGFCHALEYVNDRTLHGKDAALVGLKDRLLKEVVFEVFFKGIRLPVLGGRSVVEWANTGVDTYVRQSLLYSALDEARVHPDLERKLVEYTAATGVALSQTLIKSYVDGIVSYLLEVGRPGTRPVPTRRSPLGLETSVSTPATLWSVDFDRSVVLGTASPRVIGPGGSPLPLSNVTVNGWTLNFESTTPLERGAAYRVVVPRGAVLEGGGGGEGSREATLARSAAKPNAKLEWRFSTAEAPLQVGMKVVVGNTGGAGLRLRTDHAYGSSVARVLPDGSELEILDGPVLQDGYTWWQLRDGLGNGWAARGDWLISEDGMGLRLGGQARVGNTSGIGLNLRKTPQFLTSGRNVLEGLPEGTLLTILGGPFFQDGFAWWNVRKETTYGWSPVAYWLTCKGEAELCDDGLDNDCDGEIDDQDPDCLYIPGTTERVSVDSNGVQGNAHSYGRALSADGRFVAFSSRASNLVDGDTYGRTDIFVRDRLTHTTERVSISSTGAQANGSSYQPDISADGRFVAFVGRANNLVAGDTNDDDDIFVHDRQTGTTERVSVSSTGAQANSYSDYPAISANGRFVAFSSPASNLVDGDTNPGGWDIFVHDRQTGTTERVSVSSSGAQANSSTYVKPAISADGRFVAFSSGATNLVDGDTNRRTDVFVHDRQTGATERVSLSSTGAQASGYSYEEPPAISADGRFVAFPSVATGLVDDDTNGEEAFDVFVHDRQTGATERVSVSSTGAQASGGKIEYIVHPAISADGRFVAFPSAASNLVDSDTNDDWDVFVHDRQTGATERVSVSSTGAQANSMSLSVAISADGRFVAFSSDASNLVAGDTNGVSDIFVHALP